MKTTLAVAAFQAAFLCMALHSTPAAALTQCAAHADMLAYLARNYQETPIARGVTNAGALVEVLSAAPGGTWSVIVTDPATGMSCLVAAGEGWRQLGREAPKERA